jgi:ABC-type maltose transport system permease subunit
MHHRLFGTGAKATSSTASTAADTAVCLQCIPCQCWRLVPHDCTASFFRWSRNTCRLTSSVMMTSLLIPVSEAYVLLGLSFASRKRACTPASVNNLDLRTPWPQGQH